jgi:hypothetical protein
VKALKAHKYPTAILYFKKAVKIKEKVPYYLYAESYANLGVIYQFHSNVKNHLKLALGYYQAGAKIDPDTWAIKKYYKKLKAQLGKAKAKPATASPAGTDSNPAATPVPAVNSAPAAPAPTPSAGNSANTDIKM